MPLATAPHAPTGYLGPPGSWTHQACIDLYGEASLTPYAQEPLFAAFADRTVDRICVPVMTSLVGATPYLDDVLGMRGATIVAEHCRMLGYSLLARPGTVRERVTAVLAHPVALAEVKAWLDREMPTIARTPAASAGAAAQHVAHAATPGLAALGPAAAAGLYGLVALADGIEEGPHNVTRWWVMGRTPPPPSGHDRTSLLLASSEQTFGQAMQALAPLAGRLLSIHQRPSRQRLDTHLHLIELAGHATEAPLKGFLAEHPAFGLLGSYPRRC